MPVPARHVFVCLNDRPADDVRGACLARGGQEIYHAFKQAVKDRGLKGQIRVTRTGCLGQCAWGPTLLVYPEGIWYGRVTLEDLDEILDRHLIHGEPVARLQIPEEMLK